MATYDRAQVITFRKTSEPFGGLSNMAPGFPIEAGGQTWLTSEALYQAMRFSEHPEVQEAIRVCRSPMQAKMVAKKHKALSRPDWELYGYKPGVRTRVMAWALGLKWAQNPAFRTLLESTKGKLIVEESHKDGFWGAVPHPTSPDTLIGDNTLGLLLMDCRRRIDVNAVIKPDWHGAKIGGVLVV